MAGGGRFLFFSKHEHNTLILGLIPLPAHTFPLTGDGQGVGGGGDSDGHPDARGDIGTDDDEVRRRIRCETQMLGENSKPIPFHPKPFMHILCVV